MTTHNSIQERGRAYSGWTKPKGILKNQYLWNQQITKKADATGICSNVYNYNMVTLPTTPIWWIGCPLDKVQGVYYFFNCFPLKELLQSLTWPWSSWALLKYRVETHKPQSVSELQKGWGLSYHNFCLGPVELEVDDDDEKDPRIECVGVHKNYHG